MKAAPSPPEVVARILAAAEGYEFRSYVIGFWRPDDYDRAEHERRYRQLKIAVGTELEKLWPARTIDFNRPELRIEVQEDLRVRLVPAPLYLCGRYRKLSRQIPASRWIHQGCHGRGCEICGYTGNLCGPSVQEIFSGPLLKATGGAHTLLHALGREDTDARMLGSGRPFVLEVHHPRRRSLDLESLAAEIDSEGKGLAELLSPAIADRSAVKAIKAACCDKTYRAWVVVDAKLPPDAKGRVEALAGAEIVQYSPTRVMHHRGGDRRRVKRIVESRWAAAVEGGYAWEVRAEAGAYIKELVSGDAGRTCPSLSEALGVTAACRELDVLEVHWPG
jgi:tRNA pseudouridine synthase 10